MNSGIPCRIKCIRRECLIADAVAGCPPHVDMPGGRFVKLKGECVAIYIQFTGRLIINHEVVRIHT